MNCATCCPWDFEAVISRISSIDCYTPVISSTITFGIHTELLLHVKLLLLRDIFCIISVDNKIEFTCTKNIENRVKQCKVFLVPKHEIQKEIKSK